MGKLTYKERRQRALSRPLTAARVRELLDYDPDTGLFSRRLITRGRSANGPVGSPHGNGYLTITVDYRAVLAHRLAWLWMTGKFPRETIDHINGDKTDNRWANLRPASLSENNCNVTAYRHNTSGFKGVHRQKDDGKYRASLSYRNKTIHLGTYDTPEAAYARYCEAGRKLRGEFFNPGETSLG